MPALEVPIALTNGTHINYVLNSILKILTIQILFNIPDSNIYLKDISGNNYFPNAQGEFVNINEKILLIQPSTSKLKLETIFINNTDSRFVFNTGDYYIADHLVTGYNAEHRVARRSLIKFDNLSGLNGKKIVKAYLRLFGMVFVSYSPEPREVFVHRIEESYGNIIKWSQMPYFDPKPDASIMVGEINELVFYWDVTSLVKNWIDNVYPNYGMLIKQDDPFGQENSKSFYRTSKPPKLKVICLSS